MPLCFALGPWECSRGERRAGGDEGRGGVHTGEEEMETVMVTDVRVYV